MMPTLQVGIISSKLANHAGKQHTAHIVPKHSVHWLEAHIMKKPETTGTLVGTPLSKKARNTQNTGWHSN